MILLAINQSEFSVKFQSMLDVTMKFTLPDDAGTVSLAVVTARTEWQHPD